MGLLEELAEEIEYDPDTGLLWWKKPGKKRRLDVPAGAPLPCGYWYVNINRKLYKRSRLGWALYHGQWPAGNLDHKDGRKTRDHIDNLREATKSQNGLNRGNQINNTSGFKGVDWSKKQKKWRSRLSEGFLGYFNTAKEAASVYDMHAIRKFGEFAKTNLPTCEPGM